MSSSDISELRKLDSDLLDEKIINSKELADLSKKSYRQEFKPHVFKQKRLNLAQLQR